MWTLGVTLVIQFEENKLRKQEIEVRALIAIVRYGKRPKHTYAQKEAFTKLYNIAFPEKLAERINQETL